MTPLDWLYSVQQFGIKPGLDNMRWLLKEMQVPGPHQRFYHVAGTNGKGSTCAFMESLLRAAGERTGIFTSPHLVSWTERIRVIGEMIPLAEAEASITALRDLVRDRAPHPTFFELTLMLGLDWFERSGAEAIVLETGMGGRLDATNALTPVVTVLTPIGMDHQQYLGDTLGEIAGEKAGIIKPGIPVVSAPQEPAAERVIREVADRLGAPLQFIHTPWAGPLPVAGRHQRMNAALAIAALTAAGTRLTPETISLGLASTRWPARFEILADGQLVLDGAHNPHGTAALVETWRDHFPHEKATIVYGAVACKSSAQSLLQLAEIAQSFHFVAPSSPRALAAAALVDMAPPGIPHSACPSLSAALAAAQATGGRVLVCGSLYLCGEVLALRAQTPFEISAQ